MAWLLWAALAAIWLVLVSLPAHAQGMESVLSPGKLIKGHEKVEGECAQCHRKFDRSAQDSLCGECHKDVRADVQRGVGFHGRQRVQPCRSCHTDHKGREANIVQLDERRFDHKMTDYVLTGKHAAAACKACHPVGRKWRDAPSDCVSCHRKDDVHKGALGSKCQDCHNDVDWKKSSFNHDKTRFALTFKHADAKCTACHKDQRYVDAPRTCIGCHRKDDEQLVQGRRGHQGHFGERCESCHDAKAWKPSTFNHDRETEYLLRGKHRSVECRACHTGNLYRQKVGSDCLACHKKDDKHEGTLGTKCADCHNERGWKERGKFDHEKTGFPLRGKHVDAKCDSCHTSTVFKDAPKACAACHLKEDKHEGTLGKACESCHGERDWKTTKGRFDHDKTRFALRHGHAAPKVECKHCHRDLTSMRDTPMTCFACHEKDDKHQGQQGRRCEDCHVDRDWKTVVNFDHARTRFALTGRHLVAACKDCHTTPRFKDAPRDCLGCHEKDDKHKRTLGATCESCHNTRAWSLWTFDHDKASDYKLTGAHVRVACMACHDRPAPKGKLTAPVGRNCVACHRKDDAHDGGFGARCEQCHGTDSWKRLINRGIDRTRQTGAAPPPVQAPSTLATAAADAAPPLALDRMLGASSHAARQVRVSTIEEGKPR